MPIVIDLQVGTKDTDAAFSRLEKALDRLDAVQKGLNQTLQATASLANQTAGAFGRMAQGARQASSAASRVKPPPVQDPVQAQAYARHWMQMQARGIAPPGPGGVSLFNQAQRKINAADPQRALQTAMMRTRFTQGVFGKMIGHPLGVDLMKVGALMGPNAANGLFGGGAGGGALAGVGFAAAGAVAALTAFAAAVQHVGTMLQSLAAQTAASANSAGSVQGIRAAAAQLGMDPAQLARQVQGAVGAGGIGAGFGIQAGINPVGGSFGDMGYAEKARKALKFVAGSKSFDEARRRAEGLGIPEAAQFFYLNPSNKAALMNNGFGGGAESVAAGANFRYAQERIGASFWKVLEKATPAIEYFANGLSDLADVIDFVLNGFKKSSGGKSYQERQIKALDDNTRAINGMRETLGGGPRAQGALPSGIKGQQASQDYGQIRRLKFGPVGPR